MSTNIIDRLTATLEARTTAALAGLDTLDAQLAEAIEHAERIAQERISARLDAITGSIEQRLAGFTVHVTEMAGHALQTALDAIGERLDHATAQEPEQPHEPALVSTPAVDINSPEWLAEVNRKLDEQATRDRETTTQTVAACVLESGYGVTTIDDDTEDQDGIEDSALMETAGDHEPAVATTYSTDDLHERRGNGRGCRYVRAEFPQVGETYHRKIDGRWTPVRLIG